MVFCMASPWGKLFLWQDSTWMFLNQLISMKERNLEGLWSKQAMCESQIHWTFSLIECVLHLCTKKSMQETHHLILHTETENPMCRGICFCGGATSSRAGLEAQHAAEVTLPCSPCPSSVWNETFKVFRMWVISNSFVSKGHCGVFFVLFFFFLKVYYHRIIHRIRRSEAELLSLIRKRF